MNNILKEMQELGADEVDISRFYTCLNSARGIKQLKNIIEIYEKMFSKSENKKGLNNFPTSEEARKMLIDEKDSEVQEIKELILKAINDGETEIYLTNRKLNTYTEDLLESKGYKVKTGGRYNEINTTIDWSE